MVRGWVLAGMLVLLACGGGDDMPSAEAIDSGACDEGNAFGNVCRPPDNPGMQGGAGEGETPPEPFPELACPHAGVTAPAPVECDDGVDLESDPNNCAVCGRSCGGAACTQRGCTPEVLYRSDTVQRGTRIFVRGDEVFWSDTTGSVFQLVPGAEPMVVARADRDATRSLVLCDGVFYWAEEFAVRAYGMGESEARRVASMNRPTEVACHDGEGVLYVLNRDDDLSEGERHAIFRVTLPEGEPEMVVAAQPPARDLRVDGDMVVWATEDSVRAWHKAGDAVEVLAGELDNPHHLQLADGYVYWVVGQTDQPQSIQRTSASCRVIDTVVADAGDGIYRISIDEQYVYWSNWSALHRAALAGDWPQALGGAERFAAGLTHTRDSLLWFEDDQAYQLMRAAK